MNANQDNLFRWDELLNRIDKQNVIPVPGLVWASKAWGWMNLDID